MQTPITYKIENVYTISELYYPLAKRFNDKLKLANNKHKLITLLEEFESGTIFRNYCAHWKNEASQFTKEEIEEIFKKWLEIEEIVFCTSCKSFVHFNKLINEEYVKCNCGSINLKEVTFYSRI